MTADGCMTVHQRLAHWVTLARREGRDDFMAVSRFLERAVLREGATMTPLGEPGPDPIHFSHDPALHFPPASVSSVGIAAAAAPGVLHVRTAFCGLTGSVSPLPQRLIEALAMDGAPAGVLAFFDVFHHRILTLLYCLVSRYDLARQFTTTADDVWSQRLLAWSAAVDGKVGRRRRLRWAPLFMRRGGTVAPLLGALRDLLTGMVPAARVRLEPMTGGWQTLAEPYALRLGRGTHALGSSTVLGAAIMAPASGFTVRLGPLDAVQYAAVVEGGRHGRTMATNLQAVAASFASAAFVCTVRLLLQPHAAPPWHLGESKDSISGRLGVACWLGGQVHAAAVTLQEDGHDAP